MRTKVCILGSTGALGRKLTSELESQDRFEVLKVVRDSSQIKTSKTIYWNFKDALPHKILDCDFIINCARDRLDFQTNVNLNKLLINELGSTGKLILISSNCIYAKPNGRIAQFLFKGDAYIREKLLLEKHATNTKTNILRPTVVVDEGSWSKIIHNPKIQTVVAPRSSQDSHIKIATAGHVSNVIIDLLKGTNSTAKSDEVFEEIVNIQTLFRNNVEFRLSNRNFFESHLKNFFATALCSAVLPDKWAFFLQRRLLPKSSDDSTQNLTLTGMTRLYLCGKQTKGLSKTQQQTKHESLVP